MINIKKKKDKRHEPVDKGYEAAMEHAEDILNDYIPGIGFFD